MKNWKNQIEILKLATEQERNRESHFFTMFTTMLDSFCAATEIIPDLASVHTHTRFLWRGEAGCADLSRISDRCSYFSVRKNLFQKYHNTLFCLFKILHKHCFQFLLGLTIAPREMETFMFMQNFGGSKRKKNEARKAKKQGRRESEK